MADLEGIFSTFEEVLGKPDRIRANRVTHRCDFGAYDDDDLMSIPAHTIAYERRLAALGGRAYVTGDNCATDLAVLRIDDEEAATTDFKPHISWASSNPAPAARTGRFKINRRIANHGIAPRLAEPAPPKQTSTGVFSATEDDTPLAPIERAILRGSQVIQVVKKAGGDHVAMAELLGKIWGDVALFNPVEEIDLLGDVTLPRVLARDTKRRFEIYRNIGFTSLVSAGGSSANASGYGSSSVINWQRRVELAKLYLHFAQSLEGGVLTPDYSFSITARIPAHTVPHVIWEDLALDVDPEAYPAAESLAIYTSRAQDFVRGGMHGALIAVSDYLRARRGDLEQTDLDAMFAVAGKYDQLTYLELMPHSIGTKKVRPELAYAKADNDYNIAHGSYKAHDIRVATVELVASSMSTTQSGAQCIATLNAVRQIEEISPSRNYATMLRELLSLVPDLLICARIVAARPISYEDRHKKAEWNRLARAQLPDDILKLGDTYSAEVIALGVIHTLLRDKTSQVNHTVSFQNAKIRETLESGIRRKRTLLGARGQDVAVSVHAEIHSTNRQFYRERYRRPAKVWKIIARHANTPNAQRRAVLNSAWWFARSDAAHSSVLAERNGRLIVQLPDKRLKSVLARYLFECKRHTIEPPGKLSEVQDVWAHVERLISPAIEASGTPFNVARLKAHFDSYLESQMRDHTPAEAVILEIDQNPVTPVVNVSGMLDLAHKDNIRIKASVDTMVSTWLNVSGASAYIDEDESDTLVSWMESNLHDFVDSPDDYIATYSKDLTENAAQDLVDEWYERWQGTVEENEAAGRGEIA